MDTVVKNINLAGKTEEQAIKEIDAWINDAANKLNVMLNLKSVQERLTGGETKEKDTAKEEKADQIIGQGTTKSGLVTGSIEDGSVCHWRKWKSGVLEIWGTRKSADVYVDSQISSGYVSRTLYGSTESSKIAVWGDWPIPFVEPPSVSYRLATTAATTYSGDYEIIHSMHDYNTTTLVDPKVKAPSFAIRRETQRTYRNPVITFYAIGMWK